MHRHRNLKASDPTNYEGFTYDANGNVLTDRRRSGETISLAYDALGRLTAKTFPAGTEPNVYYGYDLLNRGLFADFGGAGGSGVATAWDALSRRVSTTVSTTAPARTLSYQYDLGGNRTRITWPDAAPNALYVKYLYDNLGRMTQIEENGATSGVGVLASYQYDNLGRVTQVSRAGGGSAAVTTAAFDPADRLSSFAQAFASPANSAQWGFSYTGADQLVSRTATNDAYSFHPPTGAPAAYLANGLNQYASVAGTAFSYKDAGGLSRGNLTSDGARNFTYDLENHLLTASAPTAVSLGYDPLGRLQTSTAAGAATTFLYDGADLVAEYDSAGNILGRYAFGPGVDNPVVWYQGPGTTGRNWLHTDNQNSVVAWSDATGALVASRAFDPYGEPPAWSGPRFSYTGQAMIPQAQLYFYKSRVYDPDLGRFLQTDTIGYAGDVNAYAYVGNDPISGSDPTGTDGVECSTQPCSTYYLFYTQYATALDYSHVQPGSVADLVFTAYQVQVALMGFGQSTPQFGGLGGSPSLRLTGLNVPQNNPCASAGQAPAPSKYADLGQLDSAVGSANPAMGAGMDAVYLYDFHRGGVLDAQRYGGSPAYANYAFGVYMAASGASLSVTLSGANAYASCCSRYPPSVPMSPTYPSVPASNVANITQGYNDQRIGTTCSVGH